MLTVENLNSFCQVLTHLCPDCVHNPRADAACPMIDPQTEPYITCLAFQQRAAKLTPVMSDDHILAIPDREPCAECVTRKGTVANSQHHDQNRFQQCLADREPFLCGHGSDAGRVCGGWLRLAKRRAEAEDVEAE